MSSKEVKLEMLNLNIKKPYTKSSIPATILKQCVDIYLPFLTNAINKVFLDSYFPKKSKKAEIISVYKKGNPLKSLIYNQINSYMSDKLSKYITGFRKCYGTQHSLLLMHHIHRSFKSLWQYKSRSVIS